MDALTLNPGERVGSVTFSEDFLVVGLKDGRANKTRKNKNMHKPIIASFFLLSLFWIPQSTWANSSVPLDNQKLVQLYSADQKERKVLKRGIDWEVLASHDKRRRAEVLAIIENHGLRTSLDYYHAAMIFQHGESADDIRLAYSLAWIASTLNSSNSQALWLSAAAWDRIMMREKMPQWYGTQFSRKDKDAPWELYKVDESAVTDDERIQMGVPTLEASRKRVLDLNKHRD
jgi:hypothetical protein